MINLLFVYIIFNFFKACKKASIITPVPGGVGPLIVSMFLKNIVTLWNNKYSKISQN